MAVPMDLDDSMEVIDLTEDEEDEDDVVLIPQHVETIDLCSDEIPRPSVEVGPRVLTTHCRGAVGPVRPAPHQTARSSPYQAAAAAHKSTPKHRQNLDDSLDDNDEPTQRVKITCPICFDSSMKKKMVSTKCGHIHCQDCLKASLRNAKKCPVCREPLNGKDPYHPIFFNGH